MASATEAKRTRPPGLDALVTTINLATLGLGTIISMAADSDGTRFVCTDSAIYAFSPNGMKLLIAGHKTERGFADGDSSAARFDHPCGITLDGKGNALVADTSNHALRKITLRCGTVTTLAGSGWRGYTDGIGEAACFNYPWGIVVDAQGTIFVADCWNHCLRQVEPDNGAVSTLAGDGNKSGDFADGQSASACFHHPRGLAVDTDGHLIVADFSNNCIRKVTIDEGRVTTVAGSAEAGAEFADGEAMSARFHSPNGIAVDGNNNILVTDQENHHIRMIAGTGGRVTTVAGSAEQGMVDGTGVSVRFNGPSDLVLDERGVLLVLECDNAGSVRVVQASLAPPQRLAPKLRHAVQDSLWIDYNTLIGDTEFAEETFAVGRQHFPAHRCVSDSAEQGKVDDTGVCVCFSRPSDSALDEQGLLVMECDDAGSVHAVEASPAPKLAVQDPLQNPMRMDYNEIPMRMDMLGENNLADVTFQANEQCFPAHRCVLTQSPRRAAVRRNGTAGGAGGQGMSRLDAVVCVLKATGKALHYDVITRQAIHQGILHFTGTQGTVGESMKVSCACTHVCVHTKSLARFKSKNTQHHICMSKETDLHKKRPKYCLSYMH